jgi:hypothetical protein
MYTIISVLPLKQDRVAYLALKSIALFLLNVAAPGTSNFLQFVRETCCHHDALLRAKHV